MHEEVTEGGVPEVVLIPAKFEKALTKNQTLNDWILFQQNSDVSIWKEIVKRRGGVTQKVILVSFKQICL